MGAPSTAYSSVSVPRNIIFFSGLGKPASFIRSFKMYSLTSAFFLQLFPLCDRHRRGINTEEKAKVIAACLEDRIYTILCRTSYFALG